LLNFFTVTNFLLYNLTGDIMKNKKITYEQVAEAAETLADQQRKQFAEKLKKARINAGLTQAQLAAKVGMKAPAIARLETGGSLPRPKTIETLAAALGVSPHTLEYSAAAEITFDAALLNKYNIKVKNVSPDRVEIAVPGSITFELPIKIADDFILRADSEAKAAFEGAIQEYRANAFMRLAFDWYMEYGLPFSKTKK